MQPLKECYAKDSRTQQFVGELKTQPSTNYQLSKTSFDAVFVCQIAENVENKHWLFLSSKEEAEDFYSDIKLLNPQIPVVYLEPAFQIKHRELDIPKYKLSLRSQSIEAINSGSNGIIITYPQALLEKLIVPSEGNINKKLHKGSNINLTELFDELEHMGYERTNYVYEYGQYAVRGNILDVFSYAYSNPIRFELFDIEIEEIREFDVETQLSLSPRQEATLSASPSIIRQNLSYKHKNIEDFIQENDVVWLESIAKFQQNINQELQVAVELAVDKNASTSFIEEDSSFEKKLSKDVFRKVILTQDHPVEKSVSPSPIIHKNFNKLYQSIFDLNKDGFRVFIQSEDKAQFERYDAIFKDLGTEKLNFENIEHELSRGFIDPIGKVAVFTSHEIFARRKRDVQPRQTDTSAQSQLLKAMRELVPGDFVTHIDHGVGRFSGLEKIDVGGHTQEAVRLIYANNDILYVHINSLHKISKYVGKEGTEPKMHRLGSDTWENVKRKTKKKIKDIAEDLIKLYAKRKATKGFAFSPDTYLQYELESSFEYEDTPDQAKSTLDVKIDMEKEIPMDRLICGDVGFGKTEVAIRAAFKAVADSKQVAVLVPTTLLAFQHYHTFSRRLEGLPCNIEFINRFKTTKEKNEILKRLEEGKVDILIGTHALIGKNVKFKDLGLLIIDEEQKFGVAVKEKLKEIKLNVDTLTLTATPIPRTLQFSLLGARDYSLIQTPPPNRQSVYTEVTQLDPEYIKEIIQNEVGRGGQVFFVHNKVKDLFQLKEMLTTILPNIDVALAHGQLDGEIIEKTILDFMARKYDVLLSTNIIESGIDIPNANTILVNNAHQFGLSDLHQLRGRVGRGDRKAYCYLLTPPYSTLTNDARQRLKAMENNAELGSGFQIAMRDLDLRGAGNLLGGEQSGFISDIGYDTFMKILDEAITELKEVDYKDLYQEEEASRKSGTFGKTYIKECQIETDYDMYIPDSYIKGSQERLNVYTELNQLNNEAELELYLIKIKDVYGTLPRQIKDVCDAIRLKWLATQVGMERIIIKNGKMRCYLIANQDSSFFQSDTFGKMLNYLAAYPVGTNMKQTAQNMIIEFSTFKNCVEAKKKLEHLLAYTKV